MKIYPIYQFPKSSNNLEVLLRQIEEKQPVNYNDCLNIISGIMGNIGARVEIMLRNLNKLGFVEGKKQTNLSWETQIYLDMDRDIENLVIYYVYDKKELFNLCNKIIKLDPHLSVGNRELARGLINYGYEIGKIQTASEKISAIKNIINCCLKNDIIKNPFEEYLNYINFLDKIQKSYLKLCKNNLDKPIEIQILKEDVLDNDLLKNNFDKYFLRLYKDPIYSSCISLTSVIKKIAEKDYYKIGNQNYYYFRLIRKFI